MNEDGISSFNNQLIKMLNKSKNDIKFKKNTRNNNIIVGHYHGNNTLGKSG